MFLLMVCVCKSRLCHFSPEWEKWWNPNYTLQTSPQAKTRSVKRCPTKHTLTTFSLLDLTLAHSSLSFLFICMKRVVAQLMRIAMYNWENNSMSRKTCAHKLHSIHTDEQWCVIEWRERGVCDLFAAGLGNHWKSCWQDTLCPGDLKHRWRWWRWWWDWWQQPWCWCWWCECLCHDPVANMLLGLIFL